MYSFVCPQGSAKMHSLMSNDWWVNVQEWKGIKNVKRKSFPFFLHVPCKAENSRAIQLVKVFPDSKFSLALFQPLVQQQKDSISYQMWTRALIILNTRFNLLGSIVKLLFTQIKWQKDQIKTQQTMKKQNEKTFPNDLIKKRFVMFPFFIWETWDFANKEFFFAFIPPLELWSFSDLMWNFLPLNLWFLQILSMFNVYEKKDLMQSNKIRSWVLWEHEECAWKA